MSEIERIDAAVGIDAGGSRTFDLDLAAGEFLHATVEQHGIDVALSLLGPAGETMVRVDSPVGAQGAEELVAVTAAAGRHRLVVDAYAGQVPGEIVLRRPERRPASEEERALVEADRAYREGRELARGGEPVRGIARLEQAREVFRQRSWGSREALALDALGEAYQETGALQSAADACEAALELYRRHGLAHMAPHLLDRAGAIRLELGQAAAAVERLSRAVELLPPDAAPERRAAILARLARARRAAGDPGGAGDPAPVPTGGADGEARGRALAEQGLFLLESRQPGAALDAFAGAVEILRRPGGGRALAVALSGMAAAALEAGELARGKGAITEALARFAELGDRRERAVALNTLGNLERRARALTAARAAYEEALALAEEVEDRGTEAMVLLGLGYLDTLETMPHRGLARIERAQELFGELGDAGHERAARVRAAEALAGLGRLAEARERLEPVLALLDAAPAVDTAGAPLPPGIRLEHLRIAVNVLRRLEVLEPGREHGRRAADLEARLQDLEGAAAGAASQAAAVATAAPKLDIRRRSWDPIEPPVEPRAPTNPAHTDLPGDEGEPDPEDRARLEALRAARRAREEATALDITSPSVRPAPLASAGDEAAAAGPDVPEVELVEPPDLTPAELGRRLVAWWRAGEPEELAEPAKLARDYEKAAEEEKELSEARRELPATVDHHDLAETGWAVIFHRDESPQVVNALWRLIERRRVAAGGYFKELTYEPGMTARRFLWKRGESPGVVDPEILPYYLLIVGGPEKIPFEFQYQLSINHAVGRIAFDDPGDYRRYAEAVLEAEDEGTDLPRRAAVFSVENPGDRATSLMAEHLVTPLATKLAGFADWEVEVWGGERSSKCDLRRLLGGDATPGLLVASCHGIKARPGSRGQTERQGALLCGEWPGKGHPLDPSQYLTGRELAQAEPRPRGLIAFLFGCYGAGTPFEDNFPHELPEGFVVGQPPPPPVLADEAFTARLPQALLGRGALAVVGHIDRGWTTGFHWATGEVSSPAVRSLVDSLKQLLGGFRLGHALRPLARRYTAIAGHLADDLDRVRNGRKVEEEVVAFEWTAHNDARNLILLGDPAVYLLGRRSWHRDLPGGGALKVALEGDLAGLAEAAARAAGMTVEQWVNEAVRGRLGEGEGGALPGARRVPS